ncbi:hypothetical protein PHET_04474 [Paragonimus heterotremus]|uniref:Uncharacterized protein n=1 Tax=Paragonimus heterotremus TaxID=100268 RepID=A0A8J4T8W2_9TREM|nr:hypothetical protein PHET_04474 [Paragonimus heterotremus]
MVVIHSSWRMRNNWIMIPPYRSLEELRSLVDQNKPLLNDTPAYHVTGIHRTEIIQTALLYRLSQDVHLLLLKVDMLEKLMRSKLGVDRSSNDDTKSLACLPFMTPYHTLIDFDTGEVILTSEEKRKTAVLSTYTSLTIFKDALSLQIRRNHSGESASKSLSTFVH